VSTKPGQLHNYRYYTCYSRQRYGKDTCGAERVAAGTLDGAVLDSLLRTLYDQRLLDEAVEEYLARARAAKPNMREQAAAVAAEIRRAEEALDRYFNAFESGKMSEDLCQPRIEALAEKIRGLQSRQAELTAAMDDEELTGPSAEELAAMVATVEHAIEHGPNTLRKAVLQEFVVDVRIESRRVIWPTFRLPLGGVREVSQMVPAAGFEPAHFGLKGRCSARLSYTGEAPILSSDAARPQVRRGGGRCPDTQSDTPTPGRASISLPLPRLTAGRRPPAHLARGDRSARLSSRGRPTTIRRMRWFRPWTLAAVTAGVAILAIVVGLLTRLAHAPVSGVIDGRAPLRTEHEPTILPAVTGPPPVLHLSEPVRLERTNGHAGTDTTRRLRAVLGGTMGSRAGGCGGGPAALFRGNPTECSE
jgi:hypothetical protein